MSSPCFGLRLNRRHCVRSDLYRQPEFRSQLDHLSGRRFIRRIWIRLLTEGAAARARGSDTIGLKFEVNNNPPPEIDEIIAINESAAYTGKYTLRADVWINWAVGGGTVGTTSLPASALGTTGSVPARSALLSFSTATAIRRPTIGCTKTSRSRIQQVVSMPLATPVASITTPIQTSQLHFPP